jgi:2-C-methyl-D-erythritol 4-phosphate cytidylyltransferase
METVSRDHLFQVFTPQVFFLPILKSCHEQAKADGNYFTDDSAIVEHYGHKVHAVCVSAWNIKVTEAADLELAALILMKDRGEMDASY